MSIALSQILKLVGTLDDAPGANTPRERFREFLRDHVRSAGELRDFVQECRLVTDAQHSRALQDLTNHAGTLLGFDVQFGRYAGVPGQVGHDGLWTSPSDPLRVVVEVKTSETYPIKVSLLLDYINKLAEAGTIPSSKQALGLFVIARPDPEVQQVQHAIVAQGHGDRLRLVSLESLLTLAELLETYDVEHRHALSVLRPSTPAVDPLVELLVRVASGTAAPPLPPGSPVPPTPSSPPGEPRPTAPDSSASEPRYHLVPASDMDGETASACVESLVHARGIWAFSEKSAGRKHLAVGDRVCFYAAGVGIVADARVARAAERESHPSVIDAVGYPWVVRLDEARIYTTAPILLDAERRAGLEAFQQASEQARKTWSWFVQTTHRVSAHDFRAITAVAD